MKNIFWAFPDEKSGAGFALNLFGKKSKKDIVAIPNAKHLAY